SDIHNLFHGAYTLQIYTPYLHDALPISLHRLLGVPHEHALGDLELEGVRRQPGLLEQPRHRVEEARLRELAPGNIERDAQLRMRSEEHTSELQSRENLVCRLLLEKKKKR